MFRQREFVMKRTQPRVFLIYLVAALAVLTFAATASAGWTWTGAAPLSDEPSAGPEQSGWTWDDGWTWDENTPSSASP
jgi:hypothetical protein